jgi:catechol 2,3-dioxygenase-like lactoylglutathione lyase family enzyme
LRIDHLNMSVTDLAASISWYSDLFGFAVVERGVLEDGRPWAIIRAEDALLAMYEYSEREFLDGDILASRKIHGLNHFGLTIEEPDVWLAKVKSMGVKIEYGGVVKWPNSRAWYVQDPSGWEIEVVSWDGGGISFDKAE